MGKRSSFSASLARKYRMVLEMRYFLYYNKGYGEHRKRLGPSPGGRV